MKKELDIQVNRDTGLTTFHLSVIKSDYWSSVIISNNGDILSCCNSVQGTSNLRVQAMSHVLNSGIKYVWKYLEVEVLILIKYLSPV